MSFTAAELAEIAAVELTVGVTAIVPPPPGQDWAVSANGHWDYERVSPGMWHAWDRRRQVVACYGRDANHVRRQTFEMDHPLHNHPRRDPSAYRFEVV